jgi:hypothetical protein
MTDCTDEFKARCRVTFITGSGRKGIASPRRIFLYLEEAGKH